MGCFQAFLVFSLFRITAGTARSFYLRGWATTLHTTLARRGAAGGSSAGCILALGNWTDGYRSGRAAGWPLRFSSGPWLCRSAWGHECFSMFKYRKYSWVKIPLRVIESSIDYQDLYFFHRCACPHILCDIYMFYGSVATPAIALSPPHEQDWNAFKRKVPKNSSKPHKLHEQENWVWGETFGCSAAQREENSENSSVAFESVLPSDSNVARRPLSLKSLYSDAELGSAQVFVWKTQKTYGLGKSCPLKLICYWSFDSLIQNHCCLTTHCVHQQMNNHLHHS